MNFKKKIKPQNPKKQNKRKEIFLKTFMQFLLVEIKFLMALKAQYFQKKLKIFQEKNFPDLARVTKISDCTREKVSSHSNLKILTPKEILQKLPIALVQVKASNTSENLLNEIRQIIYSFY